MSRFVCRFLRYGLLLHLSVGFGLVTTDAQSIRREFWMGVPGTGVDALLTSTGYPDIPSGTDFPTSFEGPSNWLDRYGSRFRGYVHPPLTGDYTFWISGDDNCLLFVGTDETAASSRRVAAVASWTLPREWDKEPGQQSAPIRLEAGRRYYVEALQKEDEGSDHAAVGWRLPDGTLERPIPGHRLSPFLTITEAPQLIAEPVDLELQEGDRAVFTVGATGSEPLTYEWRRNGERVFGEDRPQLHINPVTVADDEAVFECVVSNPLGSVVSRGAILRVHSETTPPALAQLTPAPQATVRYLSQVQVLFTELVANVTADDLLLSGRPAVAVTGFGAGPYTFSFSTPPSTAGRVTLAWAAGHEIHDLARNPNAFQGESWTLNYDPDASMGPIIINEFLASNSGGLLDEDGQASDWIELHNRGGSVVNLTGWSLSDNPADPSQWVLPEITLPGGAYLLLFASGKDRREVVRGSRLHLNFKLSQTGEPLILFSPEWPRVTMDGFTDAYPEQRSDYSYGRSADLKWHYFAEPTPAGPNVSEAVVGVTDEPHFSATRGTYISTPTIHLSCATPGATIRFTTDGSEPTVTHGTTYTQPLEPTAIYTLRAAAFHPLRLPSRVVTHSYFGGRSGRSRSLPILSLVTDNAHLWGPTGIMEPGNTIYHGPNWERPVSAEYIRPEDNGGFAVNCGLRIQGGGYVRERYNPTAALPFSKYSLRLYFRGDYGPSTLRYPLFGDLPVDEFERLVLRAGMNDHSNPFIVDELARRLHGNMGHMASHGTFAHLYLNGQYKGYYNPTERIDADFLRSWTGSKADWDLIAQFNEVQSGDTIEWNRLSSTILRADLSREDHFAAAADQLDIDAFIDYLLLNIYAGMGDWPWNNWRAARERVPGAKWFFIVWDAEWGFGNVGRSVTRNTLTEELAADAPIANFFRALCVNPDFRLRFADRFHRHFFNGGALTDENILAQYWELRNQMTQALPGMSDQIHNNWIPRRRSIMIQHLKEAGLFASDPAPRLNRHGGTVPPGFVLSLSADYGTIYYTRDGSDPAAPLTGSGRTVTLVSENAPKHVLVPSPANGGDSLGESWQGGQEPFDASAWTVGVGGVGYDRNADYADYFTIDVGAAMDSRQASVFVRIPFDVTASGLDNLDQLALRVRYDDGFVALLNGVPIASANAPASPAWNAQATGGNPDSAAVNWQFFDVSAHRTQLRAGRNILALQGLNSSLTSSDLLLDCVLSATESSHPAPSSGALQYMQPFALRGSSVIKARSLWNNEWSALLEAPFTVNLPGIPVRISEIMYHPFGGEAYEFIELVNLDSLPVRLDGMTFEGIDFLFPPGILLPGNSRAVVASNLDPQAFTQRYPGAPILGYYAGSLANGGERIALLDSLGNVIHAVTYDDAWPWPTAADGEGPSLELLDPYANPNAAESWSSGTSPGGTPGSPPPEPSPSSICINEVMAANLGIVVHEGSFPDWIELLNTSASTLNLSGWSLTDSPDPRRFVFPAGTLLAPGSFLVVWADTNITVSGLHTGFSLKSSGETIALYDAESRRIDALTFGPQIADTTLGRDPLGGSDWTLCRPTPGAENTSWEVAPWNNLRFNEWLASSPSGTDDWIELFNIHSSLPVSLQGVTLQQDDTFFRISSPLFVPPRGFLVMKADKQPGPEHVEFKLSAGGGTLTALDPGGTTLDSITFGAQISGVTEGRLPDGTRTITAFPLSPTPGTSNYRVDPSGPRLNEFQADNRSHAMTPNGRSSDWIELFNPTTQTVDLTGFSMVIGDTQTTDWQFPAGVTLAAGGYLLLTCDSALPASGQPEDIMNLSHNLPREGGLITLLNPARQILGQVRYGPQLPDRSCGWVEGIWRLTESISPGAPNGTPHPLGDPQRLRINEWMANPRQGDGWFEIFNPNPLPVDMAGLWLSDDSTLAGMTNRPPLPPLSFIGAESWLPFIADGSPNAGPDHASFKLDPWGEQLVIATGFVMIDSVDFGAQSKGVSMGRFPDGLDALEAFPDSPSPGDPNFLPLKDVVVNEILAHTDPPLEDAIELANLTNEPVNVGGWYLSDSPNNLRKYRIPDNTWVPASGFRVFYEADLNGGSGSIIPFTLNSYLGDSVYLSATDTGDALTGYRSQVHFGPSANGISLGRTSTSLGPDFAPQIRTSFGMDTPSTLAQFRTGAGAVNAGPRVGPVVLQEIMATPPDLGDFANNADAEFVEIANGGARPIALFHPLHPENTWRLENAIRFEFPARITLAAGEEILIVGFDPLTERQTLENFRSRYSLPQTTRVFGPYEGRLADEGECIELLQPDSPQLSGSEVGLVPYILVEKVCYEGSSPWPEVGIGLGASLQRRSPVLYANEPQHWETGPPSPGLATIEPSLDGDGDGLPDAWERDYGLDPLNASDAQEDLDHDGMSNRAEYRTATDPTSPSSLLQLQVYQDLSSGQPRLNFYAAPGLAYSLQYRDALGAPPWSNLIEFEPGYVGALVEIADPLPANHQRFYRILTPGRP